MSKSDVREEILRVSADLFARRGYAATSTRVVAEAVGIQQPSLFHHFKNKAAIMDELLQYSLSAASEVAHALSQSPDPPAESLYRYLRFDIEFVLNSPYRLAGLDSEEVLELPAFDRWRRVQEGLRAARARMLRAGIEAREFIDIDVDIANGAVTGLILGVIQGQPTLRRRDVAAAAEQCADLALRAVLRRPEDLTELKAAVASRPIS